MINFRMLKKSDIPLWICVGILILFGFAFIYSSTFAMLSRKAVLATNRFIDPYIYLKRHFFSFLIGLFFMGLFSYTDYKNLKNLSYPLYLLMILMLLLVLVIGYESYGAQRWLGIGFFSFQPSEISKLILIIVLAKYFSDLGKVERISQLIPVAILVAIPFFLVFKQPDLGTSLVFIAIAFGMIIWSQDNVVIVLLMLLPVVSAFLSFHFSFWLILFTLSVVLLFIFKAKISEWISVLGANVFVLFAVPVFWNMLRDYQKQRLLTFLDPYKDPFGAGYHTIQSLIAIGSGGIFGRGFLKGTQTQLQFIPQQWTDFIFSAIGEELGFIGSVFIILIFAILVWRAFYIASNSRDFYGSILASGIGIMFLFHFFVNVAMTLGIAPVVGIPLPFISFGGTSLIISMSCIGILQSISMRREKLFF